MPIEVHDSRGAPVLPRIITRMGDGSTPLTNRDMTADILAIKNALDLLTGSSISRSVQRFDGCDCWWNDYGDPLAAGVEAPLLSVSGKGSLRDLHIICKEYTSWFRFRVTINGVSVFNDSRICDMAAVEIVSGVHNSRFTDSGLYQGVDRRTSPDRWAYVIHLGKDGYGRFNSSCQVTIHNFHATDSRKVCTYLLYTLAASVPYIQQNALEIDPAEVRRETASRLDIDQEDVTVAREYNWSDEAEANVPCLITLVHRKALSPSAEAVVRDLMAQLKAPEKRPAGGSR